MSPPLLEHGLLLLLFLLLAVHDGQDDLPLFLREVAEVRHLGLRGWRRLRSCGAAPGPGGSRHVWWELPPPLREALPELRQHQRERPAPGEAHTNQYPVMNRQPSDGPAGEGRGAQQPRPRTHPPGRRRQREDGDGGAPGGEQGERGGERAAPGEEGPGAGWGGRGERAGLAAGALWFGCERDYPNPERQAGRGGTERASGGSGDGSSDCRGGRRGCRTRAEPRRPGARSGESPSGRAPVPAAGRGS